MYRLDDLDLYRQRRREIMREVENDRLVRQLRLLRSKKVGRAQAALAARLGKRLLDTPADPCARNGECA